MHKKPTSSIALRVRNACILQVHGESKNGAARLPAIEAEMRRVGYFAKVHYASKAEMIKFTVNALKAKHDAIQRGVKKSERTKFPITAVEEIAKMPGACTMKLWRRLTAKWLRTSCRTLASPRTRRLSTRGGITWSWTGMQVDA